MTPLKKSCAALFVDLLSALLAVAIATASFLSIAAHIKGCVLVSIIVTN